MGEAKWQETIEELRKAGEAKERAEEVLEKVAEEEIAKMAKSFKPEPSNVDIMSEPTKLEPLVGQDELADRTDVLKEKLHELEYEVSGLKNELQKTVTMLASRVEDDKEPEGWREVYRFNNPEIKGAGVAVTTAERREGHVIERGYCLEIRDVEGEEPRLRVRRMNA